VSEPPAVASRTYVIAGLRTHVLEAGGGRPVVLLHGGEWGGCAALTWSQVIPVLATRYRVIAPDWLGFGDSAKVIDFEDPAGRRLAHLRALLETLGATDAAFAGSSMGGALLLAAVTSRPPVVTARALILAGAGGFVPDNAARQEAGRYDGTFEGMRRFLRLLLHDPRHADDDALVTRWHQASMRPGAFEVLAAARLSAPGTSPRSPFGRPDTTPYEQIKVPVLVAGGDSDTQRLPGWMDQFVPRLPCARAVVYPGCGHLVPVDAAGAFAQDALRFLLEAYPPEPPA